MEIKVVKFGGSSLADAEHFRQVADIIRADPSRRYVVASAPGKRFSDDVKVTDMLYRCYAMIRAHEEVEPYYEQARLVICHGGLGTPLELLRMKKPFIMIPRLAKYHEHINDHQVENSEIIARKYGIKYVVNLDELTPSLLTHYDYAPEFSDAPLEEFRKNVRKVFFP
mgnify:CR=1 FL=1